MVEHGGRLRQASREHDIRIDDWLDLSTGIAPWPYPVPAIPSACWQRLPEDDDGLIEAARGYYGARHALPVNGSQAAILALPRLFAPASVALLAPSYGEYLPAWQAAGHRVQCCAFDAVLEQDAAHARHLMLANPNNPDGRRFAPEALLAAAARLARHDGWLIVDEAFADAEDGLSLAGVAGTPRAKNVIVLRSLGKFFGLAGARVGFCLGQPELLTRLAERLGPWPLAHPARFAAKVGLGDTAWQAAQKRRLHSAAARLAELLTAHGFAPVGGTALFQFVATLDAARMHDFLARRGILVRHFAELSALRFGLPGDETAWSRLAAALDEWREQ